MSELTDNSPVEGAGPFLFEAPELLPGETWHVDLRRVKWNGTKRGLQKYVPFDTAGVTNSDGTARVLVTYNGQYDSTVLPNSVETFSRQGVAEVSVTNQSSTDTIVAGDVVLEVTSEPYGADERALEEQKRGPVSNVLEHVTGLSLGGGR